MATRGGAAAAIAHAQSIEATRSRMAPGTRFGSAQKNCFPLHFFSASQKHRLGLGITSPTEPPALDFKIGEQFERCHGKGSCCESEIGGGPALLKAMNPSVVGRKQIQVERERVHAWAGSGSRCKPVGGSVPRRGASRVHIVVRLVLIAPGRRPAGRQGRCLVCLRLLPRAHSNGCGCGLRPARLAGVCPPVPGGARGGPVRGPALGQADLGILLARARRLRVDDDAGDDDGTGLARAGIERGQVSVARARKSGRERRRRGRHCRACELAARGVDWGETRARARGRAAKGLGGHRCAVRQRTPADAAADARCRNAVSSSRWVGDKFFCGLSMSQVAEVAAVLVS